MKKNLLVYTDFHEWMGGLYYVHNMIYALEQCDAARQNVNVYMLVYPYNYTVFQDLADRYENVHLIRYDNSLYANMKRKWRKIREVQIRHQEIIWGLSDGIIEKYNIDFIFPFVYPDNKYFPKGIVWIPDFQHFHFPDFFTSANLSERKEQFLLFAQKHNKLVLSSRSAFKDYEQHYREYVNHVYIIPFVSEIPDKLRYADYDRIKQDHQLPDKFFMISNQFWRHKNHILVFEAIQKIREKYGIEIQVVCTGLMEDVRNPEYISNLKSYIHQHHMDANIKLLGLIDREIQLQVMMHALAVVQPSLFEGWGTVVEDAKTLQVPIIMSDLDVHYEQQVNNCVIFNRFDSGELADVLYQAWSGQIVFEQSNYNVEQCARIYGQTFWTMISE